MPWVYTLRLTDFQDAGTVQSDWQAIAGEAIDNGHGGVSVGQRGTHAVAVVVSQPREPNYSDMETTYGYVTSVTESHEIPKRSDSGFEPPIDLGHGIQLLE